MTTIVRSRWMKGGSLAAFAVAAAACAPSAVPPPSPPDSSHSATTFQVMVAGVQEAVSGARVSPEFFPATKVMPLLGRSFAEGDWQPIASAVAIISHGYWSERFGTAPEIIGRSIDIDGSPVIVVGVMPRGFDTPPGAKIWRPRVAQ